MDINKLNEHIASGLVRQQSHPTLPIRILNYSAECQYDRKWDDVTLQCRGLVMHDDEIVARPFRKFFNESEYLEGEIPWHLPSRITEKLDGSLLIWFCFNGEWIAATRGSFTSEQSAVGRNLILERYTYDDFMDGCTYLFEVIYPENRIVVNYGDRREVVLLAVIDTESGDEMLPDSDVFHVVRSLPPTANPRDIRSIISDEEEGYVVRFDNGFRVKVKGQRYVCLHKVISGISTRVIWEYLAAGKRLEEILELVPDECGQWVAEQRDKLQGQFDRIENEANYVTTLVIDMPTRKDQAQFIIRNHRDISAVCFAWLDGKDYAKAIWDLIYPGYERPQMAARLETKP